MDEMDKTITQCLKWRHIVDELIKINEPELVKEATIFLDWIEANVPSEFIKMANDNFYSENVFNLVGLIARKPSCPPCVQVQQLNRYSICLCSKCLFGMNFGICGALESRYYNFHLRVLSVLNNLINSLSFLENEESAEVSEDMD